LTGGTETVHVQAQAVTYTLFPHARCSAACGSRSHSVPREFRTALPNSRSISLPPQTGSLPCSNRAGRRARRGRLSTGPSGHLHR
jgi:hypothetical protein